MNRNTLTRLLTLVLLAAFLAITGCGSGSDGSDGATGATGAAGTPGAPGDPGAAGGNVQIQNFHGAAALAEQALVNDGKFTVEAKITSATADASGVVTVNFTVKKDGVLYPGATGFSFDIAKLVPRPPLSGDPNVDEISWNQWVPYIYRKETAGTHGAAPNDWPATQDGKKVNQANSESNGTLTDHGDGSYTYVFKTNLTTAKKAVAADGVTEPGEAVTYDRHLTHRVALMMGGHSGPTDDDTFDFVPDGSAVTETRNIIATSGCQGCHGTEFHGHGGNRVSVEVCVTCHNPSNTDAQSGNTLDMKVMIHKIHMGAELEGAAGPDGILWGTPAQEADNGEYSIWGYQTTKHNWWKVEFPAVIENCTKCHQGGLANQDNWKTKMSRAACGSCHANVNFATGANHGGGAQPNDNFCSTCHKNEGGPAGSGLAPDPVNAHHWTTTYINDPLYDARNNPEFTAEVTLSGASGANGEFLAGDSPKVTVALKDLANNYMPMDSVNFKQASAIGCTIPASRPFECTNTYTAGSGYAASNFFVQGPRGLRVPVLTTAARAEVLSSSTGPFDISAASATLVVWADQGVDVISTDGGGTTKAGKITVNVSAGTFGSTAAATASEIVTWLNANAAFKARAIASVHPSGKVSIRSRNLGKVYGIQLQASAVTTAVFAGDTTVHMPTGSTASNKLAYNTATPSANDPKVQWATPDANHVTYNLDPVDDLVAGTYVVNVEIGARGRATADSYKTPSVAKKTFQVKTATEELAPAGNCDTCHQSQGEGMVFDPGRHHKIFDDTAVDQCGACHDYMPQTTAGTSLFDWPGAIPISRRVHGVHFGSSLNYPLLTIRHADENPARLWRITFPQDVRNCDTTCHQNTAGPGTNKTSGSWATKPARIPCMGCHDSDYATAHMTLMTYDPTPTFPWSGDEQESCKTCH